MSADSELTTKMSGYLEKKGRLRIGSMWKKYWFVLEGRLLLYYRSKDEYETLSPCKGSINLCPPCNIRLSMGNYSFQIECRTQPFTLRAENRTDQERWMQVLLAAIAQTKCPQNRMSHFRYSLDDLHVPIEDNRNYFLRQNTMPYRISNSTNTNNRYVVDKLRQIGAHTYGGSLESIVKLSDEFRSKASESSNSSRSQLTKSLDKYYGCKTDNPNVDYYVLTNQLYNKDRIGNFYVADNEQYSVIREENSIDMLSYNDAAVNNNNLERSVDRSCSSVVENEVLNLKDSEQLIQTNYLYEKLSSSVNLNELYERLSDNNSDDSRVILGDDIDHEYSFIGRKKLSTNSDYFETSAGTLENLHESAIIDSDNYAFTAVNNAGDSSTATRYNVVEKSKRRETLYEDLDAVLRSRTNTSNPDTDEAVSPTSSNGRKKNPIKRQLKKLSKLTKPKSLNETNKKPKLKVRSMSFLRRVWGKKSEPLEIEDDSIYDTVDYNFVKREVEHETDIQMLEELQKILETRKNVLQQKLKENQTDLELKSASLVFKDEWRPSLPPRQQSRTSTYTSKSVVNEEDKSSTRNIDEIMKELDGGSSNKYDSNIKFNIGDIQYNSLKEANADKNKNSDELSILLEELARITCAPIMIPGVTSSLTIAAPLNEEWLKLIQQRKRSSSEPDYDVPRPHTSLIIIEKQMPLNKFETSATSNHEQISTIRLSSIISIEPDSLEIEKLVDVSAVKVESHQLLQDNGINCEFPNNTKDDTTLYYVEPKQPLDKQPKNAKPTDVQKDESEETFIDSLEGLSEVSTAF